MISVFVECRLDRFINKVVMLLVSLFKEVSTFSRPERMSSNSRFKSKLQPQWQVLLWEPRFWLFSLLSWKLLELHPTNESGWFLFADNGCLSKNERERVEHCDWLLRSEVRSQVHVEQWDLLLEFVDLSQLVDVSSLMWSTEFEFESLLALFSSV